MVSDVDLLSKLAEEQIKSALIHGNEIEGVELRSLPGHRDRRGFFTEIFQDNWKSCIQPVQWSIVHSESRVFRGCHFHRRHDEFFCLVQGTCMVGLKDIRPKSITHGVSSLYQLYDSDLAALFFPRGLVHGWYFFEKSIHVQAVSECFNAYGADDNLGCRWDDPDLDLPWGVDNVILSDRAAAFPSLKQLILEVGFTD